MTNDRKEFGSLADVVEQYTGLLKSKELQELLNTDKNTLARWVRQELIPAIRIGKNNRFDPLRVAAWLRDREIG